VCAGDVLLQVFAAIAHVDDVGAVCTAVVWRALRQLLRGDGRQACAAAGHDVRPEVARDVIRANQTQRSDQLRGLLERGHDQIEGFVIGDEPPNVGKKAVIAGRDIEGSFNTRARKLLGAAQVNNQVSGGERSVKRVLI